MDKKTYRIENVYRVLDSVNGGSVTIQEDSDGCYDMDGVKFTLEQIPGIIHVLIKLKEDYDKELKNEKYDSYYTPDQMAKMHETALKSNPPF